jgi:Holliday junction resolvase-like predicted endonuclease
LHGPARCAAWQLESCCDGRGRIPWGGWRNSSASHLRERGYRILARQHSGGAGEIDLIALDGDCLVFVEVKTRTSRDAGHPTEAITPAKQKKLTDLALIYLKRHGLLEQSRIRAPSPRSRTIRTPSKRLAADRCLLERRVGGAGRGAARGSVGLRAITCTRQPPSADIHNPHQLK